MVLGCSSSETRGGIEGDPERNSSDSNCPNEAVGSKNLPDGIIGFGLRSFRVYCLGF